MQKFDRTYRDWLIAGVAASYFAQFGQPIDPEGAVAGDSNLDAYTYHDAWVDLLYDLAEAGSILNQAAQSYLRKHENIDSYLTLDAYIDRIVKWAREHDYFPPGYELKKLAKESITE